MEKKENSLNQLLSYLLAVSSFCVILMGCKKEKIANDVTVISGAGDISQKVNEFRHVLGDQLNTSPGSVGGRREINWDGVPAELLDQSLPENFFNTPGHNIPSARQKGLVYSAASGNFHVSKDGFAKVNPLTAAGFTAFSGAQTFANVGSNLWTISFQVPGEPVTATIKGFGMVFSDVDAEKSTFIEFFDDAKSLGKYFAPVHDAGSNLSFLGVYFRDNKVTHLRVGHDGTLGEGGNDVSAGGQKDFVVFDDFLFNEPVVR